MTFALRSKAWQPRGVTATEKEWLSSSLLGDLANGKLDPVDEQKKMDWDYSVYAIESPVTWDILEKLTNTNIEDWKLPVGWFLKPYEVFFVVCFHIVFIIT